MAEIPGQFSSVGVPDGGGDRITTESDESDETDETQSLAQRVQGRRDTHPGA